MTNDDGSQRRDATSTDRSPDAAEPQEAAAAPVVRLLANPRRVRRT